jgi:lipoprotein-anchoring transpeptidase ErfK/SrfK
MNSIISLHRLRRTGRVLAGAALTVMTVSVWVAPTQADSLHDSITEKVVELQASQKRWIFIDLKTQRLIALEGATPVYAIVVSTGKNSSPTRPGIFKVQSKILSQRLRGAGYNIPNVPYIMFYQGNYAIHGAYWHHQFGTPVSHGCVNVAVNHARWLFAWASVGTPVLVY